MLHSGSATNWWERSPNGSNSKRFCNVNSNGNANNNNASNSNGVAFGFCSPEGTVRQSNRKAKSAPMQKESLFPVKTKTIRRYGQPDAACMAGERATARFMAGTVTQIEHAPYNHSVRRMPSKGGGAMTSEERHEARYRRRCEARQRKRDERNRSFEEVFSFENLYKAGKKCCRGVGWKCSTQRYMGDLITNTARTHRELMDGTWKTKGFHEFDLMERGKLRHIRSVHITERVVQRCLCDEILVPVFSAAFIYDNAASLKNKGIDFAMDRMNAHLQRHYRKYGMTGGVLVYDFSDYFNSAPHEPIYRELRRRIPDERVRRIAEKLMEDFGERGFGLGSQVSQIDALMLPNKLDHAIKEKLGIRGYGRYMDDGYLIHEDIGHLKECLAMMRRECETLGIRLNEKKTAIIPLPQGTKFLKTKFKLTETGKVVRKMNRKGTRKMREKLKKFYIRMNEGTMTEEDIRTAYESWRGHMRRGNSWRVLQRMDRYYKSLYA